MTATECKLAAGKCLKELGLGNDFVPYDIIKDIAQDLILRAQEAEKQNYFIIAYWCYGQAAELLDSLPRENESYELHKNDKNWQADCDCFCCQNLRKGK